MMISADDNISEWDGRRAKLCGVSPPESSTSGIPTPSIAIAARDCSGGMVATTLGTVAEADPAKIQGTARTTKKNA